MDVKDKIEENEIEFYYIDNDTIKMHYSTNIFEGIPYTKENLALVRDKIQREYEEYMSIYEYYAKKMKKLQFWHEAAPLIIFTVLGILSYLLFSNVLNPILFKAGGLINTTIIPLLDILGLTFGCLYVSKWCECTVEVLMDNTEEVIHAMKTNQTFIRLEKSVNEKMIDNEKIESNHIKEKIDELKDLKRVINASEYSTTDNKVKVLEKSNNEKHLK